MDQYIEDKSKMKIQEIVSKNGWPEFRKLESVYLKEISLMEETPLLLDTGGGIVENVSGTRSNENISILKDTFFTIYLYIPKDKILDRLSKIQPTPQRPTLNEANISMEEIYERRSVWFKEACHAIVDTTDTTIKQAVERIIQIFKPGI